MTSQDLNNLLTKLKCCSARLTNNLATNLSIGGCNNYKEIVILNSYIDKLLVYLNEDRCLDEEQYENIVNQSKNICELCDCGTIITNTYNSEAIPQEGGGGGGEFVNPDPYLLN